MIVSTSNKHIPVNPVLYNLYPCLDKKAEYFSISRELCQNRLKIKYNLLYSNKLFSIIVNIYIYHIYV